MMVLTDEEQQEGEGFIRRGKANARTLTRAHVLLKDAEGWTIARLSDTFTVSPATLSGSGPSGCAERQKAAAWPAGVERRSRGHDRGASV